MPQGGTDVVLFLDFVGGSWLSALFDNSFKATLRVYAFPIVLCVMHQ